MKVSGKLRKTYLEVFNEDDLSKRVKRAVFYAFEQLPHLDVVVDEWPLQLDSAWWSFRIFRCECSAFA